MKAFGGVFWAELWANAKSENCETSKSEKIATFSIRISVLINVPNISATLERNANVSQI
jgi:hypothetical protein